MSRCITRIGFQHVRRLRCNALHGDLPKLARLNINRRCIADRSFRLANVGDLAVAQEFKDHVAPEHYVTFVHTADVIKRDMDKQIVIDLSHEQGYKRGHIKGAINLPLEQFDFCRVIDQYGGITQDEVYAVFKSLGVSNETSEIILYDNSGLLACRLWFVLRYYGFQNVRILNGGWRSWLRAGLPVDEKESVPTPAKTLDLKPKRDAIVTKPTQMVFDHEHKTSQIVDTRRPDVYQEYHIPRAINIPSKLFMQDGEFKPVKAIRDILQEKDLNLEDKHTIIYSSKGLTSAVGFFCMTMAGMDRVSVYDQGIYNWIQNFESKISPDIAEHLQR
mmetsp:Transcript_11794/g.19024  ORF Transcript_11794/g.19024 Transcript_11794/m.19024 type:complete len:332 (-) Transcript_11794:181-1176(-)|eukprot:CAMPEP_0197027816 /NCGR_PEP_ID=MMETSP1384-20130603/7689_1 /TAXON_ID=29189 /ORGANISM="Ammonia sp." /LENGTH=331 /DNA_ID=CAMNT_0042456729 /DNA_START=98 /DNA_END=1093 /DNA_ORIENTATION=+